MNHLDPEMLQRQHWGQDGGRMKTPDSRPPCMAGSTLLLLFAPLDPGGVVGLEIDPLSNRPWLHRAPSGGWGVGEGENRLQTSTNSTPHGVCQGSPDYAKCKHVPLTLCTHADKFDVVPYFCI